VISAEIEFQNLRNKYQEHAVIKPLIKYCEEHHISFEFLKETVTFCGIKSFNRINIYYMKIGEDLIKQGKDHWQWNNLFSLINCAYNHLNIKQPSVLLNAYKTAGK